ncbi:phosphonate ABC transporter ATP-binding protein [Haloquadratum walsbyi]|uniref:ABC-type transport system ATP-binding protein (Probable substrate phosphate/phosphonate) n=1 Tax=Haloquadratum walsbyi (strain DSM 16854 / JCM 12705 / C23) TaxID=768065 RepID=G0LJX0_HALWC|nr:phosphonate ABC transporter ATP-binding protein [Haloquadratum walsbyi]CCC39396.1 ABC-type transport system ATP-binding protein (probable substrate phosphate/phosphonate) [Haloquadratum walsbyi C23]
MPHISLQNVTKLFGEDTIALDDVSIEITAGEFVVILGPSGAGKSTLLRILNGLTEPTTGTAQIGGSPVSESGSDVGMVFQMHYLIESLSAYRNALTGALSRTTNLKSILTLNQTDDKRAALRALDTVGLLKDAEQRAGTMSGGQKQRVGIARALVQNPSLLLADEPVSSLDPKAARDVMRYMKQAARERELTTVASLHQVNIAREFGDRFIGVRDGTVIFDGSRAELSMDVIDDLYYAGSESTPVSHGDIEGQGEGLTKPDDTSVSSDMETTSGRDHSTGTDTDTDTETDTGEAQL